MFFENVNEVVLGIIDVKNTSFSKGHLLSEQMKGCDAMESENLPFAKCEIRTRESDVDKLSIPVKPDCFVQLKLFGAG